jgi:IS30 family transposase
MRTRLHPAARGSRHGLAKLTEHQVRMIRAAARSGVPQTELARGYGVAGSTISRIVARGTWIHV